MTQIKPIYAGSFDPITLGHIDIIKRVESLFGSLTIVVANSIWKDYLFSIQERVSFIQKTFERRPSIQVDSCEGLLVDYIKKNQVKLIIRGARSIADFEHELNILNANKDLSSDCETFLAFTRSEYQHYSSKIVKEVALCGGDASRYVPDCVNQALKQKRASMEG